MHVMVLFTFSLEFRLAAKIDLHHTMGTELRCKSRTPCTQSSINSRDAVCDVWNENSLSVTYCGAQTEALEKAPCIFIQQIHFHS